MTSSQVNRPDFDSADDICDLQIEPKFVNASISN